MQLIHRFLLLLVVVVLAWLSVWLLMPPAPEPASSPAAVFSAERAMGHVHKIAREPHAMGTAAHAEVRRYLLGQMEELGLQPQVQETTVAWQQGPFTTAGHVYNLLGRIKGSASTGKALLLMAHYDSQPNTRGAADDAAGVAAILETVRALQVAPALEHDVIVLLTDGEEYGLFGARGFLEHPWAKDVALVLNVEARGNQGPSMTFELSPENGWLAKQYSQVAPYPFISSVAYEVYRRMPNDTDFTVFRNAGYSGLNSAFIDGFVHYHKLSDSPENLSQGSLQQHGDNMLALARHFGTADLSAVKAPDAVFFNFIGKWVIHYPVWLNLVWVLLTLVLVVVLLRMVLRKGLATGKQLMAGSGLPLLWLVFIGGGIYLLNLLVLRLLPYAHTGNGVYHTHYFLLGYLLVALGLFLWLTYRSVRRRPVFGLVAGSLAGQVPPMLVLYLLVPAAAYLAVFPLLFAVLGCLVVLHFELYRPGRALAYGLVVVLAAVPALFLLMPIVQVLFVVFSLALPVAAVILFLLLLNLLLPVLVAVDVVRYTWAIPAISLLAGIAVLGIAVSKEQPSPTTPLHSHTAYYLDADQNTAFWATAHEQLNDWNKQFFPDTDKGTLAAMYPQAQRPYLLNTAPAIPVAAPVATVLSDSVVADTRVLRLQLASQRQAAHLEAVLQPENPAAAIQATINGKIVPLQAIDTANGQVYHLRFYGLPLTKQVEFELKIPVGSKLNLLLFDHTIGLPAQLVRTPMPAHILPEQGRDSNLTVVRKAYQF
ncbi:M20/M25/M40 family metallo-hydrolase [Pontibacter ramchanderi]|uniref:Vacuolar membrane protease n=1 Tax=Pontibacter ramchanderi TaxID=1179743 RepID=A0A2N3UC23_9BACT|nr:M20/M25/M40 family metallo-hydrolase [Pontibacter ramchanderi]PKV66895.1 peptidase M28-like protein [Pontibacter ramchanderi]